MHAVVSRIKAHNCVYILIPGICEYITSHDRRSFADIKESRMGRLFKNIWQTQSNHIGL